MSDDSKRRRGQASRYLLGRENALMGPSEPDDRFGPYKPELYGGLDGDDEANVHAQ